MRTLIGASLSWLLLAAPALAKSPDVGLPVPELRLVTLDGSAVSLGDFRGRVVLAKFGYTW